MSDFVEKVSAKRNLSINMPIEIEVDEEYYEGTYKSIIHEFNSKSGYAKIGIPMYKGALIKLPKGIKVRIRVYSNTAVFLFKTIILQSGQENNIRFLVVKVPDIIYKVQRRKYVRIPISEDGFFYFKKDYEEMDNPPKHRFISKDFSAGGLSIVTDDELKEGERVFINMDIKEGLEIKNFEAEVVRKIGETDVGRNIYGMEFTSLDTKTEKKFVKFVFRYEIQSMKKNRL
jgi:c-di-GMP-binding flagellar brake protein YcgR